MNPFKNEYINKSNEKQIQNNKIQNTNTKVNKFNQYQFLSHLIN